MDSCYARSFRGGLPIIVHFFLLYSLCIKQLIQTITRHVAAISALNINNSKYESSVCHDEAYLHFIRQIQAGNVAILSPQGHTSYVDLIAADHVETDWDTILAHNLERDEWVVREQAEQREHRLVAGDLDQ